jgi:hypothetical protein
VGWLPGGAAPDAARSHQSQDAQSVRGVSTIFAGAAVNPLASAARQICSGGLDNWGVANRAVGSGAVKGTIGFTGAFPGSRQLMAAAAALPGARCRSASRPCDDGLARAARGGCFLCGRGVLLWYAVGDAEASSSGAGIPAACECRAATTQWGMVPASVAHRPAAKWSYAGMTGVEGALQHEAGWR